MVCARIAECHCNLNHHNYYITPDDLVQSIPNVAASFDHPFGNSSVLPAYYCARLAKADGVTRMLAGDGGDELFGGNSRYAKQYHLSLYEKIPKAVREGPVEGMLLRSNISAAFPLLRRARSYIQQASRPMPARYEAYNLIEYLG